MASKKEEEIAVIKSSGNVFADIGLVNPERHLAKVELAHQINKIIEKTQFKASGSSSNTSHHTTQSI